MQPATLPPGTWIASVWVHTPMHANLSDGLSYTWHTALKPGQFVCVPLGARKLLGIVNACEPLHDPKAIEFALKPIEGVFETLPALSPAWLDLVKFAAQYYQRSVGEMALSSLPPSLRTLTQAQLEKKQKRWLKKRPTPSSENHAAPALNEHQSQALDTIQSQRGPFLLFGQTGSGKTEVYFSAIEKALDQDPHAQVLIMVPEINLTPQLQERIRRRFEHRLGPSALVSQHSAMTPDQRLNAWMAAHQGEARIVLGTRLSILMSLPQLRLIVVDEEHDASYKQQEGSRYSARDLALYRAHHEQLKIILGSATPSLESWFHSQPQGKYTRITMDHKVGGATHPQLIRVNMNLQAHSTVLSAPLVQAIEQRLLKKEQVILLLNRRGYAPILRCNSCGWLTQCDQCSAYKVFHKLDRSLRCHHCGHSSRVPKACPVCSDPDLGMLGAGTQKIEEQLATLLKPFEQHHHRSIRIQRIDADSSQTKERLEAQLHAFHAGESDILIGTQMIAKGHDFRRVTLVAALDPDSSLYSSDFRAAERLFALLMQAAGRAGRDAELQQVSPCEMWVQTRQPQHKVFQALRDFDFEQFAAQELLDRQAANMPPFSAQALIRAEAKTQDSAQAFLNAIHDVTQEVLTHDASCQSCQVWVYSVVPMAMRKVANLERAQMLLESPSRAQLQHLLGLIHPHLHQLKKQHKSILRWAIDVDPQQL